MAEKPEGLSPQQRVDLEAQEQAAQEQAAREAAIRTNNGGSSDGSGLGGPTTAAVPEVPEFGAVASGVVGPGAISGDIPMTEEEVYWDLYGVPGFAMESAGRIPVATTSSQQLGNTQSGIRNIMNDQESDSLRVKSLKETTESWWHMSTQTRVFWQKRLVAAGFLDEVSAPGLIEPNKADYKAWENAVVQAAAMGTSVMEILQGRARAIQEGGGFGFGSGSGGADRRRSDVRLTGTGDANRLADEIGVELIGRSLNEEERARVVARLHGIEKSQQNAAIDVEMTEEGGGTIINPDSPQTIVENEVRNAAPTEAAAHDVANTFANFLSMLGG